MQNFNIFNYSLSIFWTLLFCSTLTCFEFSFFFFFLTNHYFCHCICFWIFHPHLSEVSFLIWWEILLNFHKNLICLNFKRFNKVLNEDLRSNILPFTHRCFKTISENKEFFKCVPIPFLQVYKSLEDSLHF